MEADERKVVLEEVGDIGRGWRVLPVPDYLRRALLYSLHLLSLFDLFHLNAADLALQDVRLVLLLLHLLLQTIHFTGQVSLYTLLFGLGHV